MKVRTVLGYSNATNHQSTISAAIKTATPALDKIDGRETTLVFAEFRFGIEDVLGFAKRLSIIAQESSCNIVLCPVNNQRWGRLKWRLRFARTDFENNDIPNSYVPQSIGFWFGKDGTKYAFPKSGTLHKIPGSDSAVLICSEIKSALTAESFDGIRFLYNPAALEDMDLQLSDRTKLYARIGMANQTATLGVAMRDVDGMDDPTRAAIRSEGTFASPCLKYTVTGRKCMEGSWSKLRVIMERRILAFRINILPSSGLLALPEGVLVVHAEYHDEFGIIDVDS